MNYEQAYRKLISGSSCGLGAIIARLFLGVAAQVYSIVIMFRNFLYSKGWLKTYQANAVVISVGNITAGGTGKTPLVIWLCKFLQQKEFRCAVLTRGYKATKNLKLKTQNYSGEPAILTESCPGVKVIVNPDRVAGAAEAAGKFDAKILIMDDGFQHRRLERDVDIITIDATCPFGYGKMLPAGLLREPVASLKRADVVVITRCDQVSEEQLIKLEEKLRLTNPGIITARSIHRPVCVKSFDDKEISIEELRNKKIFAFCGIGNPDAFLKTIKNTGANLVGSKIYNDHYRYSQNDIADIYEQAEYLKANLILTTEKDRTRIISNFTSQISNSKVSILFAYLVIELKFIAGEDKLKQLIESALAGKIPSYKKTIVNNE